MRVLHTGIALFMLVLTGAGIGAQAVAQGEPVAQTLTTYVRLCTGPQCLIDYNQTELASGVIVTLTDADSNEVIGSCTTDDSGSCTLNVSGSTGVYIDLDPETFPEGYRVLEGMPHITPLDQFASEATEVLQPNEGIPMPEIPAFDVTIHVSQCTLTDSDCTNDLENLAPLDGIGIEVANAADGVTIQTCTTGETGTGTCAVNNMGVTSLSVMVDTNTMPDYAAIDQNPVVIEVSPDDPNVYLVFSLIDVPTQAAPTVQPAPTTPPRNAVVELPAVLASGTCADVAPSDDTSELTNLTILEGESRGSTEALQAASGYAAVPMSIDDLTAGNQVIAIVDADDPATFIACGAIGGVPDEDGAFSIGLAPVDKSGSAGIAYLASRGDNETGISIFLVPEGLIPETLAPEASPTPHG